MTGPTKRVVVWGTGFVGRMVIPEIIRHPSFELVGVGVSAPKRWAVTWARSAAWRRSGSAPPTMWTPWSRCGPTPSSTTGRPRRTPLTTSRSWARSFGPGIDVCSTAMTPWVWPAMAQNPPSWVDPITKACDEGQASCFTTGIDPGFANDLFPMTLMGLCGEVRSVKALEILDYINYEGDYEDEMGIGRSPEFTPLLEHTDILIMSWGATVPMIAHAVGIELDEITDDVGEVGHRQAHHDGQGHHRPGMVAAIRFTINGILRGETRIGLEHINRVGTDAAPDWPAAHRTTSIGWRSTDRRRSRRRPRSGLPTGAVATPRPRAVSPPAFEH